MMTSEIEGGWDAQVAATKLYGISAAKCMLEELSAWRVRALGVRGDTHCYWIEWLHARDDDVRFVFAFRDGRWRRLDGIDAWSSVVSALRVDVTDDDARHSALRAFAHLAGPVLHEIADVERLVAPPSGDEARWFEPPKPADRAALGLFEPPHFEGACFSFQANLRSFRRGSKLEFAPTIVRVVLDTRTLAVSASTLCDGRSGGDRNGPEEGRAYVGDDGAVVHASLDLRPAAATSPAQRWLRAALAEHASVASFARASMELMAVGAPLDLVRRTHEAALDEIRHAELALSIARRLGVVAGATSSFGPLPALAPRALSIAGVATTTLWEAALPEARAADRAAAEAAACDDAVVRSALERIAVDEARHAALAWDVVDWCCSVDADARAAVARASGPGGASPRQAAAE